MIDININIQEILQQFKVVPLVPISIFGINLSITSLTLTALLTALIIYFVLYLCSSVQLQPSTTQAIGEIFYSFFKNSIVIQFGGVQSVPYIAPLMSIFLLVFTGNILGLIPKIPTITSHLIITAEIGFITYFLLLVLSIVKYKWHFLKIFCPAGIPLLIQPFIIFIEVIIFCTKPLLLACRLFLNMTLGHIVLAIFEHISASLTDINFTLGICSSLTLTSVVLCIELLASIIQALVMILFICIALKDVLSEH